MSEGSREAFAWAGAAARLREAPEANSWDLIVGLLAARPVEGELEGLLDYFGIQIATVLTGAYDHPFTPAELRDARFQGPDSVEQPSLDEGADFILSTAMSLAASLESGGTVEPRHLLGALLQLDANEAARSISRELRSRGISRRRVLAAYQKWLGAEKEQPPIADHLRQTIPLTRRPVTVARVADDRPLGTAELDFVDIQAEVDAFSYLLTSTALVPPLAIGLFGAWGSGKSFFVQSLQRRIREITEHPEVQDRSQSDLPFFKHLAQIEFNAWQYVEGDLWASLVAHIFDQLSKDERQRQILLELETAKAAMVQAKAEREALDEKLISQQAERDTTEQELRKKQQRNPLATMVVPEAVRTSAMDALAHLGLTDLSTSTAVALAQLDAARDTYVRASRLGLAFRARGKLWAPAVASSGLATIALSSVFTHFDVPSVTNVVASLAPVMATLGAALQTGNRIATQGLTQMEAAHRALDSAAADELAAMDQEIEGLRRRRDDADASVRQLQARISDLDGKIDALKHGSPQLLNEFIVERANSDDYRRHLGLPALIRQDFDTLSSRIAENNAKLVQGDGSDAVLDGVNRIVLFVDDLDRCAMGRVIEVLQAVHLLLAFPLFVVVVAVDSRWLANSLREYYHGLVGGDAEEAKASPGDYLEKIFQVPFWIEELSAPARQRLLDGLARPSLELTSAQVGEQVQQPGAPSLDGLERIVGKIFARHRDVEPWLAAAQQTLTKAELDQMGAVAPLLGSTPRSVKRFVNVYQLVKGIASSRVADLPTDHLLVLLALLTGAPTAAHVVIDTVRAKPDQTLAGLVEQLRGTHRDASVALDAFLAAAPKWEAVKLESFEPCLPYVSRFTFAFAGD